MEHEWYFYLLRVDDHPASIFVDLALKQVAPVSDRTVMAYVGTCLIRRH